MTRHSRMALAVLAAVVLAGCRPSETSRAEAAAWAFVEALESRAGERACRSLSDAGVAELLLLALEHAVPAGASLHPAAERCASVAEDLDGDFGPLLRSRAERVILDGDRATVLTTAGAFELEEREGRWLVARMDAVARALDDGDARTPVHLVLARPRLHDAALGRALAGRTTDAQIDITGELVPESARVDVEVVARATVLSRRVGGGRFRVRLRLAPGTNVVILRAAAPGRETMDLTIRLDRT